MYGPAPARSKKTSFVRSRRGCRSCRAKKRKCDEAKPSCRRCQQAGQDCTYETTTLHFHDASNWAAAKSRKARGSPDASGFSSSSPIAAAPSLSCSPYSGSDYSQPMRTENSGTDQWTLFQPEETYGLGSSRDYSQEGSETQESPSSSEVMRIRSASSPVPLEIFNFSDLMNQPKDFVSSADQQYLYHFASHVLQLLPPALRILCETVTGAALTNHAAMALGAANLAILLGKANPNPSSASRSADATHRVNALNHVGAALFLSRTSGTMDLSTAIMVQLLLSFVHAEIGDLDAFENYIRSIEGFLGTRAIQYSEELIFDTANLRPLAHPSHPRYSHLSNIRTSQPSLGRSLTEAARSVEYRFVASDAVEFNFRITLLTAMQMNHESPSMALRTMIRRYRRLGSHRVQGEDATSSMQQIIAQREKAYLDLQELAESFKTRRPPLALASLVDGTDQTKSQPFNDLYAFNANTPIRFKTHDEAMDAADYLFARALSEESPFFINPGPRPVDSLPTKWLRLLLRIAAGLDAVQCAERNKFRRGIVNMLFCANLFFNQASITSLLLDLIARLVDMDQRREDFLTPLAVINSITKVTAVYQSQGFRMCLVSIEPSKKSRNPTAIDQTRLITLYGQDLAGQPLDHFIQVNVLDDT